MSKYAIIFDKKEDKTEQSHKKECDVNHILRKYAKTGVLEHVKKHEGQYADIPAQDFREAMEIIATSKSMFEELPSEARKKFHNDTAEFLEFVQDPNNKTELHKMGLLDPNYKPPTTPEKEENGKSQGSEATSNSGAGSEATASEKGS